MRVLMSVTTWDGEQINADLTDAGFPVTVAEDGIAIFESLDLLGQPVVVMETDLPDINWEVALDQLRREIPTLSVLVIDTRASQADRLKALQLGADDILHKSMSRDEVASRILAVASRRAGHSGPRLRLGPLNVDLRQRKVWWGPQRVDLSPAQYTIFEALCLSGYQTVTKDAIMGALYGLDEGSAPRTIDVFVTHLRARLVAAGAPWNLIETVRGRGYALGQLELGSEVDWFDMPVADFGIPSVPLNNDLAA